MEKTTFFGVRRHYEPPSVRWNKASVKKSIKTIGSDVIAMAESGEKWPKHKWDQGGQIKSDFYFGKGGSLWAVDYLKRRNAIKNKFDISAHLEPLIAENRKLRHKQAHPENASYLFGEMPLLLMKYRCNPDPELADEIAAAIQENDKQPVRELMWGLAGSMLVALFMYEWTQELRWEKLYRKQAKKMLADWQKVPGAGYLWNIDLYGGKNFLLGAVHGFSGNAFALISGFHLLSDTEVKRITKRVMEVVVNTADQDERHANWWPRLNSDKTKKNAHPLLHFCHGAPGMIIPLAQLPSGVNDEFDELLLKGGELIWDAGLLEKGPNLCHGTSGNGYAFLKLYERTGDELWLKRARSYAMQAIKQIEEVQEMTKQTRRYPLWTGDPGVAIYLMDCLENTCSFPTLDVF